MVLNSQGGDAGRVSRVFARPASALPVRHAGIRWKQFLSENFAHGTAVNRKHKLTGLRLTDSMALISAPTRAAFDRPINSVDQRRFLVAPHRRCQGLHLYNVMRAVLIPNSWKMRVRDCMDSISDVRQTASPSNRGSTSSDYIVNLLFDSRR